MSVKNLILFILLGAGQMAYGQSELSSYFLKNSGTSLYLNPANTQSARFGWVLPSFYYVHGSRGPGIYGMLRDKVLDFNGIRGSLKEKNSFMYGMQGSMGSLFYRYENISVHVGHNLKTFTQFDYTDKLFDILLNGNAQYIGETVNVGPFAKFDFYNEFYLGAGVQLQNLSLGGRIKKLNGFANAFTPHNEFTIYTHDEIYQLRFNTAYELNTNLYTDSLTFKSFTSQIWNNLTGNGGWAFDFGMKADIYDQFTLSVSLIDMGSIKWDNNATKITTNGSFEFNGFDVAELITDSLNVLNLDSLSGIIDLQSVSSPYRTSLPVQFYLGLQYYPNENWEINGLFYNAYSIGQSYPSFSVMGKYKPSEYFHTSLGYTWNPFAHFNLGWSAEAHLEWFHAFIAMDNIIDLIRPLGGNYFNIRTGVQIDFLR